MRIAVDALDQGASVAVAKGGRLLVTAVGGGVAPLLQALRDVGEEARGAAFADKVIGRAAAMIMVDAGAADVYARVMSESASTVLGAHCIPYAAVITAECILNRTGTGLCPIEQMSMGFDDCRLLRLELEKKFLQS